MIRRALREQVATHVIRLCALAFCLAIISLARAEDATVLSIGGLVERPLALSMKELKAMPEVAVTVAEHNGATSNYRGVSIVSLLESAGLTFGKALRGKRLATYLLVQARDGYQVVFALPELDPAFNDRIIFLAYSKNGGELPEEEAPLRVIVSSEKREARWIRQVVSFKILLVAPQ